jgi:1-acyl-sn-glycerol-3-phosphate acyltransferase
VKFIKVPLFLIWRMWFGILMFISLVLFFPFLLIFSFKEGHYHIFWKFARILSRILIHGMGFRLKFESNQNIDLNKSYMYCPNHGSLLDPFVLIALSKKPIVFVGKKELARIPVFGFFYKRTAILVDIDATIDGLRPVVFFVAQAVLRSRIRGWVRLGLGYGVPPEHARFECDDDT